MGVWTSATRNCQGSCISPAGRLAPGTHAWRCWTPWQQRAGCCSGPGRHLLAAGRTAGHSLELQCSPCRCKWLQRVNGSGQVDADLLLGLPWDLLMVKQKADLHWNCSRQKPNPRPESPPSTSRGRRGKNMVCPRLGPAPTRSSRTLAWSLIIVHRVPLTVLGRRCFA